MRKEDELGDKAAVAAKSSQREIRKGEKLGRGSQEQPRMEIMEGAKLWRS